MRKKVVLTQEQANSVEYFREYKHTLDSFAKHKGTYKNGRYKPLNALNVDELAIALHVGYEIEKPKFKIGDKVVTVWEEDNSFFTLAAPYPEISDCEKGKGWHLVNQPYGIQEKNIRHATPEEIYWLHELGRDKVGDFREGDVLCSNAGDWTVIQERYAHRFNDSGVLKSMKGIYPAESFKPFRKDEE